MLRIHLLQHWFICRCHVDRRAEFHPRNQEQQRDPEMLQTKKGNQWYFGMKAHIGTDSQSKLIHSVVATPANMQVSQVLGDRYMVTEPGCGAIRPTPASAT